MSGSWTGQVSQEALESLRHLSEKFPRAIPQRVAKSQQGSKGPPSSPPAPAQGGGGGIALRITKLKGHLPGASFHPATPPNGHQPIFLPTLQLKKLRPRPVLRVPGGHVAELGYQPAWHCTGPLTS